MSQPVLQVHVLATHLQSVLTFSAVQHCVRKIPDMHLWLTESIADKI